MNTTIPRFAGVYHLRLPVSDLTRSEAWYGRVLGYYRVAEFFEKGTLEGLALDHPAGGPHLALRHDPARAEATAGFDYFTIGMKDRQSIEALAGHLDALGEKHGGVVRTPAGWMLPLLHDPDGHELRFYTLPEHPLREPGTVVRVENSQEFVEAARQRQKVRPGRTTAPSRL